MNELRDQLWDFVYGLLDEADAVRMRERISSDRLVAREYARVKLQSELVAQAARATESEHELPVLPHVRIASSAGAWQPARFITLTCSLALSVGLLVFAGGVYWSAESPLRGPAMAEALAQFEREVPRMVVTGPQEIQPGARNEYEVTVQALSGDALPSLPVKASLKDRSGEVVWHESGTTSADGKRQFDLPPDLNETAYQLQVDVDGTEATDDKRAKYHGPEFSTWLSVNEPGSTEIVARNKVVGVNATYYRTTELRDSAKNDSAKNDSAKNDSTKKDSTKNMESLDKVAAKGSGKSKKSLGGSRSGANLALREEVGRVRWRVREEREDESLARYAVPALDSESRLSRDQEASRDARVLAAYDEPPQPARPPVPGGKSAPAQSLAAGNMPAELPAKTLAPGVSAGGSESFSENTSPDRIPSPMTAPAGESSESGDGQPLGTAKTAQTLEQGKRVLLESISANETLIVSRIVNGRADDATLKARIGEVREQGLIDPSFNGTIDVVLYDPAVAPPQRVAEASMEILPAIEPLSCTVKFDRSSYRAGDQANVELRVSDANGEALPAVLNVQVEAIPLAEADAPKPPLQTEFLYTSVPSVTVPLVFDNAAEQEKQLNATLSDWAAEQNGVRRTSALLLLGGSAFGFGLLLIAGTRKWLPRPRLWLPIAVLLGCSSAAGVYWLQADPFTAAASVPTATPLTTFGVRSEPPPAAELPTDRPTETKEMVDILQKLAKRNQHSMGSSFNDVTLPPLALDASEHAGQVGGHVQILPGMNEWADLALGHSRDGDETLLATREKIHRDYNGREFFNWFGVLPRPTNRITELPDVPATDSAENTPSDAPAAAASTFLGSNRRTETTGRTIYWHPVVTTDSAGIAQITFAVPPGPLAYRLLVFSFSGRRTGATSQAIPTTMDYPRP